MTEVNPVRYTQAIEAGVLPLASATRFGDPARQARSIKMALSTVQPVRDDLYRERFAGKSLFARPWGPIFESLERRGLVTLDRREGTVTLTGEGVVLVEAIMNTEL